MGHSLRLVILSVALAAYSCAPGGATKSTDPPTGEKPATLPATGNVRHGCIENYDAGRDYFPDKVTLQFATVFSVEYHRSYKVVTVREASQGGPAERYILLQCGAPKPDLKGDLATSPVIQIPITSLFAGSTTNHPLLVDLDRVDVLTGIPERRFATMEEIIEVYHQVAYVAPWQKGDVVLLDNMLTAHARAPFSGERKIVVAMGDMVGLEQLGEPAR